jgi:hypothetical protein
LNRLSKVCGCEARMGAGLEAGTGIGGCDVDGGGVAVLNKSSRARGCEASTGAGIGADTGAVTGAGAGAWDISCCGRRRIWGLKAVG